MGRSFRARAARLECAGGAVWYEKPCSCEILLEVVGGVGKEPPADTARWRDASASVAKCCGCAKVHAKKGIPSPPPRAARTGGEGKNFVIFAGYRVVAGKISRRY